MAVGSCISTLVSSTNRRRAARGAASRVISLPAAAGPGSERLRRFKDFLRVTRDLDLAPFAPQHAGAIQKERTAHDTEVFAAVHALLVNHVEELADLRVLIGEELIGKLLARLEFLVRDD